ncbi:TonB-dependent receptor plug domain-containing protein [Croceibacterium aestuarii]|uniref:TonB-dependent receptor plug domain-containing protein n=1 Tax=Croceibacterium aestuarii TaxID=3064139 RepID=UPI00272DE222|nr:TonB-dependent receptor [Croceibacterium sp. D39]
MYKPLFLISVFAISSPVLAQDDASTAADPRGSDETRITVTATGTRSEVEDTGQAVTVVGRDEIEAVQGFDVARVLERVPGVTLSRNGAPGSFTGLSVRGAAPDQVVVVIDGVRVADQAAPSGGFDFGTLAAGNLAKLELLRGSNSTIWGSDAIGGVLVASTLATTGLQGSAEYGSRGTAYLTAAGGVGGENGYLGGSAGWYTSDGFSSAAAGTERDGFEQWNADGQGRIYFSDSFEIFARGRYAEGDLDIDGYPPPSYTLTDTAERQETRQWSTAAGAVYDSGILFLAGSYALSDTQRDSFDPAIGTAPTYTTHGRSDRLALNGEWRAIGPLLVDFGASYEWTRFATLLDLPRKTGIGGAYVQVGLEYGPVSGHAGLRHDEHQDFGGATSFGADLSYEVAPDLRLRASLGEGFKAPSLFQLHSDYGNAALAPEKSTSFDLGLAWHRRGEWPYAAVTLYRRDSADLIGFVSCFGMTAGICAGRPQGTYDNVGKARSQGVEVEAGAELAAGLTLLGSYSFADNANRTSGSAEFGLPLARRPRHALSVMAEWDLDAVVLGGDLRWVSKSFDDAAATVRLDPYATLDLTARVPLGKRTELFGRIENLWDEQYQTAAGYASPGRGMFVGVRLK